MAVVLNHLEEFAKACGVAIDADILKVAMPGQPDEFKRESSLSPARVVDTKLRTAQLMHDLGLEAPAEAELEQAKARTAFAALTHGTPEDAKRELLMVDTPQSVRHLVGMLTGYDWQFVQQAAELRGYTVAKILEETSHPDARIRLAALQMLGKVTEVALFTDRVEVKKTELSDSELDAKIKDKLLRLSALRGTGAGDVVDVTAKPK